MRLNTLLPAALAIFLLILALPGAVAEEETSSSDSSAHGECDISAPEGCPLMPCTDLDYILSEGIGPYIERCASQ